MVQKEQEQMMTSRDKILAAVAASQPETSPLPDINFLIGHETGVLKKFVEILTTIGGRVYQVNTFEQIISHIKKRLKPGDRAASNISALAEITAGNNDFTGLPHDLQNVELAIIEAQLGVAENGAVWIKEDQSYPRVLPFICQHLAVVLKKEHIVATMHDAYQKIGAEQYGFAAFIAGPSKTADIEQSLVLGAHGARTMTVFLI